MRVLHIAHWFPSVRNNQLGIFVRDYCHAIHEPDPGSALVVHIELIKSFRLTPGVVVVMDETTLKIRVARVEVRWLFSTMLFVYPQLQWLILGRRIRHLVDGFRPDIIHSHVVHPSGALGWKISEVFNLPHLITEHWSNLPAYFNKRLSSSWGKNAYLNADYILPVSGFLKEMMTGVLPALVPAKIVVVPDVVDSRVFSFRAPLERKEGVLRFIGVSTWKKYRQVTKRPDLMIRGLAAFVRASGARVELTLVGDGDMLPEMIAMAEAEGLDVRFVGRKNKTEIAELLASHDYFMHASEIETFSLVTAEALSCGIPALVSDAGALPHLVTGERGVVCENTVEGWADGLERITTSTYNRHEIAEAMQQYCSWEGVRKKVLGLYESAG